MRIESDLKLDYSSVLIRPKRSTLKSRSEVDLNRSFTFRNYLPHLLENLSETQYTGVPIMAANMDGVGTFEMADCLAEQGLFCCLVKTYPEQDLIEYFDKAPELFDRSEHAAMSIGTSEQDLKKLIAVKDKVHERLKFVCIDVANGYSEQFVAFVKQVRKLYGDLVIIAGNVVTGEMTEELILSGADIVKVGIGPGSVCTTRIKTGVGYPQLSAVIECADAAHGLGGHIIADGGCTSPGDVAKAFGAGADFVMLGSMLAGHDQGGGEVIEKAYLSNELDSTTGEQIVDNKQFVQFYGMSSKTANNKHFGGLRDYRSSEGRTVLVPYKGDASKTVQDILGGVRSAMTYCGARCLKEMSKRTTFVLVARQYNDVYESSTIGE